METTEEQVLDSMMLVNFEVGVKLWQGILFLRACIKNENSKESIL